MPATPACRGTRSCPREAEPVCRSVCGGGGGGASRPQAGPALLPEAGACTLPAGGQAGPTAGQAQPCSLGCCWLGLPPPGVTAARQVGCLLKLHVAMGITAAWQVGRLVKLHVPTGVTAAWLVGCLLTATLGHQARGRLPDQAVPCYLAGPGDRPGTQLPDRSVFAWSSDVQRWGC